MSTVNQPLKHLWSATFADGTVMEQPADDRSINHDDNAEHNGTAFSDLLKKAEESPVEVFGVGGYAIVLPTGEFFVFGPDNQQPIRKFSLECENEELTDRKLIFYRVVRQHQIMGGDGSVETQPPYVHSYIMGYEGKNSDGKVIKKTISIE